MRLLCFGDSNTYGYDPRGGGRYPADSRWADILARQTGWEVLNAGLNGRAIPCRAFELDAAARLIQSAEADTVLVMLGSNDLLCGLTAKETAARMEAFLHTLPGIPVLLIAPPPMQRGEWVTEDAVAEESRSLAPLYSNLARRLKIAFADAGSWGAELSFDGVHFTENGHHAFANSLMNFLMI